MTTYNVTAKRWSKGWELHIDGLGVTQSRTLASAEDMVREYVALALDIDDESSFDVVITPEIDADTQIALDDAKAATRAAEEAQRKAAARWRGLVHRLHDDGLVGSDIARVLKVSKQRVSQLVK